MSASTPLSGILGTGILGTVYSFLYKKLYTVPRFTYEPDVLIDNSLKGEVKFRKSVPKSVEEWLGENDILFMKRDRRPITVTMSFEKYLELVWRSDNEN